MSHHAPTAGGILAIIGGVFILLGGLVLAFIGTLFGAFFGFGVWVFYIGLVVGLLTIVMGVLALVKPEMKMVWGVLIIVLSIASWPTALGGFFIGFLLALIGGILILVFKPAMMIPVPVPMAYPGQPIGAPMPTACPACGGAVNPATRTCMACGRSV
jgi:hypothetical protein